ncbi:glycosyltransferase family 2 protein [Petroclostridium sp. X23]|uniref:glycosyltransferase family 2 protein n=1 Tax=Petroclostridium sp. X23 TaxID=3045146 RepID=UPI0024AE1B82|nr:glycosyltransferase family 2 protein [Petroclostridium sp. X23]WHH57423.1 glycosyltransferase family 2 protein [Petroclostridium sp. X23]
MDYKKVLVQIVTYNSEKYIIKCLESLSIQTYNNIEIIIIDNNSSDDTILLVNKYYKETRIIKNGCNIGFSAAHNIGFIVAEAEYILILNPDVILEEQFIANIIAKMAQDSRVGLVTGKVLRMRNYFEKTDEIDSTGIFISKSCRAFDRGQAEMDVGQYDYDIDVFGACGAAAIYRRAMLEDIKVDNEYFDESFFAYKEDIDLSWRARLKGWECIYCPEAVAYHMRGWNEGNRKSQPLFIRVHSIKNRILMMLKNDSIVGILEHLPQILIYELAVFFYCLLFDFKALRYIIEVVKLLPQTLRKRKLIQSTRRVDDREIYKYFK